MSGEEKIRLFIRLNRRHAEVEGMPVEVMLTQALLAGIAVSGGRLVWKEPRKKNPQVAKPSLTWLGQEGEMPLWFHRYAEPLVRKDEQARLAMSNVLADRAKARPRKSSRQLRALGKWIPRQWENDILDVEEYLRKPTAFLAHLGWKPTKQNPATGFFGDDRLLILAGRRDYQTFMSSGASPAALRFAAANRRGGLRVAVNGWCERKAFRKLCRQNALSDVTIHGWILSASRPYAAPDEQWVKASLVDCMFDESFRLRFSAPLQPYVPSSEVAERLDHAEREWVPPAWSGNPRLQELLRPDKSLPWQLAAQLANIHGEETPDPTHERHLADLAIALARWIWNQHAREIRVLFPGPEGNLTDPLSCRIADQLAISPKTPRELVRSVHKVGTDEVNAELDRMRRDGWVKKMGNGRWTLGFPSSPDVSANLSEIMDQAPA